MKLVFLIKSADSILRFGRLLLSLLEKISFLNGTINPYGYSDKSYESFEDFGIHGKVIESNIIGRTLNLV